MLLQHMSGGVASVIRTSVSGWRIFLDLCMSDL